MATTLEWTDRRARDSFASMNRLLALILSGLLVNCGGDTPSGPLSTSGPASTYEAIAGPGLRPAARTVRSAGSSSDRLLPMAAAPSRPTWKHCAPKAVPGRLAS